MKAEFNIEGSALPGWVNPSTDALIIERAYNRLNKLVEKGILEAEAFYNYCHFILRKPSGKVKIATYRDKIIERGDDSIAVISLTFTK